VTKYVDVATDDNLSITLPLQDTSPPAPARTVLPLGARAAVEDAPPSHTGNTWRILGWATTGVLAAGAITTGVLAEKASNDLVAARNTYPVTAATLGHDASLVTTYSMLADGLAIGAVVLGGVTLASTVVAATSRDAPVERSARLRLGLASVALDGTF
jgi:hypothetical protein